MSDKTISIRLYGDNISPISFRSKDIGEILISLESSVKPILKEIDPDIKNDEIFLSLIGVEDKSLGLEFKSNVASLLIAFQLISQSLSDNNFDNLPTKSLNSLKEIQSKVKKYHCNAQFILDENVIGELTPDTILKVSDDQKIKGETVIYGIVQRIGGVDPTCKIELLEGYSITASVSKDLAKEIGSNLYSIISLTGNAVWNRKDDMILDFHALSLGSYKAISNKKSFDELSNVLSSYWNTINNIDDFLLND